MQAIGPSHPLRRLFSGLIEDAFCAQVGMCDPLLAEYLVELLISFTHTDRLSAIGRIDDKRLEQIAAILALAGDDLPASVVEQERAVYRNMGDYALFWAGVYPERLKRRAHRPTDVLLNYVSQGKRSYAIVSDLVEEGDEPPASLFRHLSEDFESCLYGLSLVRRGWEQQEPFEPGNLPLLY